MDIMVSLPRGIRWEDYQKELAAVAEGSIEMRFKVAHLPKKCNVGDRCYLVWRGGIKGWMKITGFYKGSFICSITGKKWEGNFIVRSGPFNYLVDRISIAAFRGFRYMPENFNALRIKP